MARRLVATLVVAVVGCGAKPTPDPAGSPHEPEPPSTVPPADQDFDPVPPEIDRAASTVALPPVPAFDLPDVPDGFHSVKELLVDGKKLFGTEVKVTGYVTWIYDCVADVGAAGEKRAAVQKRIDADPTLCQRPNLRLGAAPDADEASTISVVDVPRAPNKLERSHLPKEELRTWPVVPTIAVGNHVVVTGSWTQRSPHGDLNTDGLLVYGSLDPVGATP